ncbi:mitochondrial iron transporter 2 [Hibiscus trionum]|uniref:Mitochondrial iron transporter 2 n=1 Tax=Hibiscus trionum TaxID=183268 RepID=A0A9W7IHP4_HIBTR|nr:mitochondrial iron transporter 2 [Hibiscus trionum]
MAIDASPQYRPVPPPPDFHPEISLSHSPTHDGLHFWQFMIAGSIAGTVEHMAMFPLDTLKTRMQVIGASCPVQPFGVRQALGSILKLEGPSGLYRGIAAMGLGAGPAHAVYFSVYELSKQVLSRGDPNNSMAHAVSGVVATVTSDAVFTPMDMVKQRLQLKSSPYKGVADCVRRVVREEGIGAFYASYRTTVVMNAPFTAVHFATYEAAKRELLEVSSDTVDDGRLVVHATAGAVSGALAAAVTTPLDVVKTQLQCQGVCGCDKFSSSSIGNVIETIVNKDGYRGLMRGWIPRTLFHAPAAATCWSTYEASKSFFQRLNSG